MLNPAVIDRGLESHFEEDVDKTLTPYKIKGNMKIKKSPELSVGPIQVRQEV